MEEPSQAPSIAISEGAGVGIRAAARIIDIIYGLFLGLVAGFIGGIALLILEQMGLVAPGWQNRIEGGGPSEWAVSLLGTLLYHWLTEWVFGASLGKLICQLRVVSEDGQSITATQAFKRSLAYFWDALLFGLVAVHAMRQSPLNQRYGDRWAKTIVVKSRDVSAEARSGPEMFVLGLLMGSVAVVGCVAAGLVIGAL